MRIHRRRLLLAALAVASLRRLPRQRRPRSRAAAPTRPTASAAASPRDGAHRRPHVPAAGRRHRAAARRAGARGARLLRGGARTRDPALARRATEIALATRQRAHRARGGAAVGELDPDAERPKQLVAALSAGSAAASRRLAGDGDAQGASSSGRSPTAAASRAALGDGVPAAQPAVRPRARQGRDVPRSSASSRKPYPNSRRGALRGGARRATTPASPDIGIAHGRARGGRSRADAEARLGARGAAQGRDPRASESPDEAIAYLERVPARRTRSRGRGRARWRSSTSSRSATPRRARCSQQLWDDRPAATASSSSASRCCGADEGLDDRRSAVRRT